MSMPSAMTRRSEVKIDPTGSNPRKRKRQESQKRELPTRHSLLTDVAVADLEDAHTKLNQPQFNGHTIIRILRDGSQLDGCQTLADGQGMAQASAQSRSELQTEIKVPAFRVIDHKIPAASKKTAQKLPVTEDTDDEAYLRRHRKHEMAEKKLKNREKERLRYDMQQQMRLVDRLKSMNRTNLLATLSSRLRRDGIGELDEAEIKSLHQRMIREAEELLMRYEALGLLPGKQKIVYTTIAKPVNETHRMPELDPATPPLTPPASVPEVLPLKPKSQSKKGTKVPDQADPGVREKETTIIKPKKPLKRIPKTTVTDNQKQQLPDEKKKYKRKFRFSKSVPSIKQQEFSLPTDDFGELMSGRNS
ncbi:hypothetical protein K450DRAFT_234693 [Umbelopsis ramanniana AG]|uniref:Something about silencing protein 4 domain-containing protein n=1 Tax=Umbelopsis ramanniana AG TaxID=1314678 RepID=A0AAD5EDT5_UMBRA|nr:uncharacterized protein K450DRAFT_234693 [Umbelopsis ramanniana AG]KAI8581111.1 hypothetical protein K450DRAFT_234693 [Umbelopsis ramanniana AG]